MTARPTEQTKEFFQQWQVYQQVIENDYMAHRSIHQAIRAFLDRHYTEPFRLLDLGCGDAQAIARTLQGTKISSYTGVDLSPNALTLAQENLADLEVLELVSADFTAYLAENRSFSGPSFDIIHVGFSLHHLLLPEKEQFFHHCGPLLRPGGYLLIYDVFRQPHQNRQQYIEEYLAQVQAEWHTIAPAQLQAIADHINECDFPEWALTIAEIAQKAGFSIPETLFVDCSGFNQLLAFTFRGHAIQPSLN